MTNKLEDFGTLIRSQYAGSISYGTNLPTSDLDVRGIFIPHRKYLVGLNEVQIFKDPEAEDTEYFDIQKFVRLALEGNPNVVEQLFVSPEHVLFENEFGKELYDLRYEFLTKNAYGRFGSYAYSQMERLNSKNNGNHHGSHKEFIEKYGYDTKHAMHLVRLFQMGIQILKYRELDTLRPNREELLGIRHGSMSLQDLLQYASELNRELEDAMVNSTIPDYPDFDKVNSWVVSVIDRAHGLHTSKGVFKGITFNVLPLEYEMVDKCSLISVSNRLVRRKNKSEAMGIIIPYKDWFVGLHQFDKPFKFEKTSIDSLHRMVKKARNSDVKVLDIISAAPKHVLFEHPMAAEMKEKLKSLYTTDKAYLTSKQYVIGNLKNMQQWEQDKTKWEQERAETGKKMTEFPPERKGTNPENSAMMKKYGYDTLKAFDIVHVLKMYTELMKTGNVVDSRAHEPELYAIKHAKYLSYEEFKDYVDELMVEFEEAYRNSVLPKKHDFEEVENWLIDFVDRFHAQLD